MSGVKTARIGDLCSFLNGGTPPKDVPRYFEGDTPWITSADITSKEAGEARSFISEEAIRDSATNKVPAGTILLVTRTSVGKVAITSKSLCFSQDITAIIPDPSRVVLRYVAAFLRSQEQNFKRMSRGATIKGIARDVVANLSIPLPSLSDQHRIADILDRADALRVKRRAALARLDELTQAIFVEMFGDPEINPNGFVKIKLGAVVKLVGGFAFKSEDFSKLGRAIIRISNLVDNKVDLHNVARMPDSKLGRGVGFKIHPGDILIAMSGATTGKIGVVPLDIQEDLYQNQRVGLYRIIDDQRIQPDYLLAFIQSKYYQRFLWNLAAGAAQPNVSGGQLESADVPLPPLDSQIEFGNAVRSIDKMRMAMSSSSSFSESFFASLQDRAFRGAL